MHVPVLAALAPLPAHAPLQLCGSGQHRRRQSLLEGIRVGRAARRRRHALEERRGVRLGARHVSALGLRQRDARASRELLVVVGGAVVHHRFEDGPRLARRAARELALGRPQRHLRRPARPARRAGSVENRVRARGVPGELVQRDERSRASRGALQLLHTLERLDRGRVVARGGVDLREREPRVAHRAAVAVRARRDEVGQQLDSLLGLALAHEQRRLEHGRLPRSLGAGELTQGAQRVPASVQVVRM